MILAAALTMFLAQLAAAERVPAKEPQRLSSEIDAWAQPMPDLSHSFGLNSMTTQQAHTIGNQLWLIVEQHENHQIQRAQETWRQVTLPAELAVWRELGLAVPHLQLAELDQAEKAIQRALELDGQHPVVFYYRGIVNLERSMVAHDYYDAIGPSKIRMASNPQAATGSWHPKSTYLLMAIQDFQRTIELKNQLFTEEAMLPSYLLAADNGAPTFGTLLAAWNVENYVGKAHNILGVLNLDRGWLEQAEYHMDEAEASGENVLYGYRDLGARYEDQHRAGDAFRVYGKAVGHDPSVVAPTRGMLRSFGQALGDLW